MDHLGKSALALGLAAVFAASAPALAQEPSTSLEHSSMIELPAAFEKSVRGCTTDGYIYRFTYNTAVNFDDLAAIPSEDTPQEELSLFYKLVKEDSEALLGISGTDSFIAALKTISRDIHTNIENVGGLLIDEASSEVVEGDVFAELIDNSVSVITEEITARYGVGIDISNNTPVQQGGRCGADPVPPPPIDPSMTGPR